jgi:acyl-CoA thioesterase FadM
MQWDFPAPFTTEVLVTDKVIDELNHTNNAEYVKWCDTWLGCNPKA